MNSITHICTMINSNKINIDDVIDGIKRKLLDSDTRINRQILSTISTKGNSAVIKHIKQSGDIGGALQILIEKDALGLITIEARQLFQRFEFHRTFVSDSPKSTSSSTIEPRYTSPYRPSDITDHGTASGIGLSPTEVARSWLHKKFRNTTKFPFPREKLLIKDHNQSSIKCPAADRTSCNITFPDSLDVANVATLLGHTYQFHKPVYEYITESYEAWCEEKHDTPSSTSEVLLTSTVGKDLFEKGSKKIQSSLLLLPATTSNDMKFASSVC
ncbi:unnamed protein product [Rotaria socialis]|uniref:Uncharacterized protein n=1 Tax=Rotaria socialis TaxID=392032 RepID=A0A818AV51_9BILA|nr:unnamed protein product [Rotaria socialis]